MSPDPCAPCRRLGRRPQLEIHPLWHCAQGAPPRREGQPPGRHPAVRCGGRSAGPEINTDHGTAWSGLAAHASSKGSSVRRTPYHSQSLAASRCAARESHSGDEHRTWLIYNRNGGILLVICLQVRCKRPCRTVRGPDDASDTTFHTLSTADGLRSYVANGTTWTSAGKQTEWRRGAPAAARRWSGGRGTWR